MGPKELLGWEDLVTAFTEDSALVTAILAEEQL